MSYKLDFLILFAHAYGKCAGRRVKKAWKGTIVRQPSLDNLRIQFNGPRKKKWSQYLITMTKIMYFISCKQK